MRLLPILSALVGLLSAANPSQGALIVNGDFSANGWPAGNLVPASGANPNYVTSIVGWNILTGSKIVGIGPNFASIPTPSLELTGWNDDAFPGGVSQTLGTTAGSAYTISFSVYDIGSLISKINFTLNGNQLGTNLNAQGGSIVGGTTKGQTYSYNFTALGSDVVSFFWPGPGGSQQVSILANVQVTPAAAVPEPGTWAAAALLVGAAGYVRWRKRRSSEESSLQA